MKTDCETLFKFIMKKLKNKEKEYSEFALKKLEIIQPLFNRFNSSLFSLGRLEDLKPEEMCSASSLAIGETVDEIITISLSQFSPLPQSEQIPGMGALKPHRNITCIDDKKHDIDSRSDLEKIIEVKLEDKFSEIFNDKFENNFLEIIDEEFSDKLYMKLTDTLDNLELKLDDELNEYVKEIIDRSLFFFLGFIITGDMEKIERLTPFMQQLAEGYFPIGKKTNKPKSIFVLVT